MNINPQEAAQAYRERIVGPYRGVLPDAAVQSMQEQLSGACTVEVAAFDEFSRLLGDSSATADYEHVIFDTAPTGHTLRLLELPAAWSVFLDTNVGGTSCLGPLSGLQAQRQLYRTACELLRDPAHTTVILVARPDRHSLTEAARTLDELEDLGIAHTRLIVNGVFTAEHAGDALAQAWQEQQRHALAQMPASLARLPRTSTPLLAYNLLGARGLRGTAPAAAAPAEAPPVPEEFERLLEHLESQGPGVVMVMGKGGVGKTTLATRIALWLARRGHPVHLTTTDPAAHLDLSLAADLRGLRVSRIDPEQETLRYSQEVIRTAGAGLDAQGLALLEEDLRSPCTEEIAVFQAFAQRVQEAQERFMVIDTAPTGHTLLLLDAAEAYHREVLRTQSEAPAEVKQLLPRLRDPNFTRILLVTLPEATPVHEAASLQEDLARAGIEPLAWVVNQSLQTHQPQDALLQQRRAGEVAYLLEVARLSRRWSLVPFQPEQPRPAAAQGVHR
jgi:arsenite-transporting ATPase